MARFSDPASSGGSGSGDTFDKIYVTHNSDGTNVKIGDDAWIGDVDSANHIAIQGVQDSSQGGVILGTNNDNRIYSNSTDMTVYAANDVLIAPGSTYAYLNTITESQRIAVMADIPSVTSKAYGAFSDHTTFGPYASNAEQALSYQTTDYSSNVHIGGINSSQLVLDQDGVFNIQFSTQFHCTSSGAVVYIWLKKNGTTIPWTGTRFDITANNPYAVAAWNWFVNGVAGDYFEIFWSTPSTNVKVEALTGLTGTKATVPSNIVTVMQVG
ncbi:MAG: hypothetical protein RLZZ196_184 [Bacteroidota bacterium]|jgi:hypothetical protein